MATFIIFLLACIGLLMMLYYRRVRQYYVDQSIYKLRDCKHDIIMFRGNHFSSLSAQDFVDIDELITSVQSTHDRLLEINGLKFKTVRIIINNTVTSMRVESRPPRIISEHPELLNNYVASIYCSFKAIPFLKLRVISHVVRLVLKALYSFGVRNANNSLYKFDQYVNANHDKRYNEACLRP